MSSAHALGDFRGLVRLVPVSFLLLNVAARLQGQSSGGTVRTVFSEPAAPAPELRPAPDLERYLRGGGAA